MRLKLLIVSIAGLFCAAPAPAALTAYEGFDYTLNQTVNNKNGGMGFSDKWTNTNSPSQASQMIVVNASQPNAASLTTSGLYLDINGELGAEDPQMYRPLSTHYGTTGTTMWISFMLRKDYDGISTDYGVINVGNVNIGAGSNDKYEIYHVNSSTAVESTRSVNVGTTMVVFASIEFGEDNLDTISLYLSPNNMGNWPVNPSATMIANAGTVTEVGFLFGYTAGWSVDELRIGTSRADVTPTPEPASLSLLVIGAAALLRRRHRAAY